MLISAAVCSMLDACSSRKVDGRSIHTHEKHNRIDFKPPNFENTGLAVVLS